MIVRPRILAAAAAAVLSLGALSACETTQDKAKALQEEGEALVANQEGVQLGAASKDVKVVDTWVITDEFGTAIAVELENTSSRPIANVPIVLDVLDAKGKNVFSTSVAGLDPSLTNVPLLLPGEPTYFVNDQILATGQPKSVKVKVGTPAENAAVPPQLPELTVSRPRINVDPSGIEAEGQVTNDSDVTQSQLVVFAVAIRGGDVVAAGRGIFKKLEAGGKPLPFNVFFIGDPQGADVQVFAPPTVLE